MKNSIFKTITLILIIAGFLTVVTVGHTKTLAGYSPTYLTEEPEPVDPEPEAYNNGVIYLDSGDSNEPEPEGAFGNRQITYFDTEPNLPKPECYRL